MHFTIRDPSWCVLTDAEGIYSLRDILTFFIFINFQPSEPRASRHYFQPSEPRASRHYSQSIFHLEKELLIIASFPQTFHFHTLT